MSTITAERRPIATRLAHPGWTAADVERMLGSGLLNESDRVELIEGALIDVAPIGSRHANLVDVIAQLLVRHLPAGCRVRFQNPIRLVDVAARRLSIHREPAEGDYLRIHPHPRRDAKPARPGRAGTSGGGGVSGVRL